MTALDPAPPGAAPTRRRPHPLFTFAPGALIGFVGAGLTAFSGGLTWLTGSRVDRQSGYDTPARFLFDRRVGAGGLSVGAIVLAAGVLGMVAAILVRGRAPAIVLGVGSVVVAAMFVYQLRLGVEDANRSAGVALQVRDVIGLGPFATGAGGVVAIVGAVLPGRRLLENVHGPGDHEGDGHQGHR
jgi:hypothetical protein